MLHFPYFVFLLFSLAWACVCVSVLLFFAPVACCLFLRFFVFFFFFSLSMPFFHRFLCRLCWMFFVCKLQNYMKKRGIWSYRVCVCLCPKKLSRHDKNPTSMCKNRRKRRASTQSNPTAAWKKRVATINWMWNVRACMPDLCNENLSEREREGERVCVLKLSAKIVYNHDDDLICIELAAEHSKWMVWKQIALRRCRCCFVCLSCEEHKKCITDWDRVWVLSQSTDFWCVPISFVLFYAQIVRQKLANELCRLHTIRECVWVKCESKRRREQETNIK